MYHVDIQGNPEKAPLRYRYLVGSHTVGIITPTRKKHLYLIAEVSGRPYGSRAGAEDGTADSRLSPAEVASFVLRNGLK